MDGENSESNGITKPDAEKDALQERVKFLEAELEKAKQTQQRQIPMESIETLLKSQFLNYLSNSLLGEIEKKNGTEYGSCIR